MLHNQESIKTETNVEKMNSLLDTVQQLQMANEVFRKQLKDAGIEPDPKPAVEYHWHHLLMGENDDRTVLEENELIQEKSIITNQKIAHLSSEINVRQWPSQVFFCRCRCTTLTYFMLTSLVRTWRSQSLKQSTMSSCGT